MERVVSGWTHMSTTDSTHFSFFFSGLTCFYVGYGGGGVRWDGDNVAIFKL